MQLIFGIGALWGQRTDVAAIGTDQFAILQDNTIDFSFELKELYSQQQFPVDIARGKGKISGKAKMARVFAALYADLFFGATVALNTENNVSENETGTVPNAPPYNIVVAHAGTPFVSDLGVYYNSGASIGKRLTYTSVTAPASAGLYYVSAGTYTFSAADANTQMSISYVFTDTSGKEITLTNNFMGYTPTFQATFYQQRATQGSSGQLTLLLVECVSSHLSFPSRIDDYGIPDFDFMAFSNQAGSIGSLSSSE